MPERSEHKRVVRQGDEHVCYACGKRWDEQDERNGEIPACVEAVSKRISSYRSRTRKPFRARYAG